MKKTCGSFSAQADGRYRLQAVTLAEYFGKENIKHADKPETKESREKLWDRLRIEWRWSFSGN